MAVKNILQKWDSKIYFKNGLQKSTLKSAPENCFKNAFENIYFNNAIQKSSSQIYFKNGLQKSAPKNYFNNKLVLTIFFNNLL